MSSLILLCFLTIASGQLAGDLLPEIHPPLAWKSCTIDGGCVTQAGALTLDANWRWAHDVSGTNNCYTEDSWNADLCPDSYTCSHNCALDGVNYESDFGIAPVDDSLELDFYTISGFATYGSPRVFLMADDANYQMFNLLNQEFSFDVDISKLPCGINGALYFVGMDIDGGLARYPGNLAGAKYGTGYCDAQCPRYIKWINGRGNVEGWTSYPEDYDEFAYFNNGFGNSGSCCSELDVWDANSISSSFSAKPCNVPAQINCDLDDCGGADSTTKYGSQCDPDGCDFNPYQMGNTTFYGVGQILDTSKPFTVTTQFVTDDGTSDGTLIEIKRFYIQGGIEIDNPDSEIEGVAGASITSDFCDAQKSAFGDANAFEDHGGMSSMTEALRNGMVLAMMIGDDKYNDLLWLDSLDPADGDATQPGVSRGSCPYDSASLEQQAYIGRNASVNFSNIRVGDIGSTT